MENEVKKLEINGKPSMFTELVNNSEMKMGYTISGPGSFIIYAEDKHGNSVMEPADNLNESFDELKKTLKAKTDKAQIFSQKNLQSSIEQGMIAANKRVNTSKSQSLIQSLIKQSLNDQTASNQNTKEYLERTQINQYNNR